MSIDVRNSRIICDDENCNSILEVPLKMRRWQDASTNKFFSESTASGWTFLHGIRTERHYCPACSRKRQSRANSVSNMTGAYA